jgi:hypothetical protein
MTSILTHSIHFARGLFSLLNKEKKTEKKTRSGKKIEKKTGLRRKKIKGLY